MSHEAFAGRQFYHGTRIDRADGILHTGAEPSDGVYGTGFYTADSAREADDYTPYIGAGVVLRGTLDVKNPKVFNDDNEMEEYLSSKGDRRHMTDLGDLVQEDGHDGMYIGKYGHAISFGHGSFHPNAIRDHQPRADERAGVPTPPWTDLT